MSDVTDAVASLKEYLAMGTDENLADYSDAEIVHYAMDYINQLEMQRAVFEIALANDITGPEFDRWEELVMEKIASLEEGEQFSEEELLELLKKIRN